MTGRAVVTGAFSFTGAAVAAELGRRGWSLHTLTNRRAPAGSLLTSAPLRFDVDHLAHELTGADVLVNTYWIRFPRGGQDFAGAVERSLVLLEAARRAGVKRLVQVSVSNADPTSKLGYYRGKAEVDAAVRRAGVSHAIVRPTLVVGPADVLTNNIAWLLRRFPVFPVPDGGRCRLQPVTLGDTARIIADAAEADADLDVDAAGPEIMTFRDYVRLLARACDLRRAVVGVPAWAALAGVRVLGWLLRDVILTRQEWLGLAEEKLVSRQPPRGVESVSEWLARHGEGLGRRYTNDVARHFGARSTEPVE